MVTRIASFFLLFCFCAVSAEDLESLFGTAQDNTRRVSKSLDRRWISFKTWLHYPEETPTTLVAAGYSYSEGPNTHAFILKENLLKRRSHDIEVVLLNDLIFHFDRTDPKKRVNKIRRRHPYGERYLNDVTAFARPQDLFASRVSRFVLGEFSVPRLDKNGDLVVTYNPWNTFTSAREFEGVSRKFFETTFDQEKLLPRHVVMKGALDDTILHLGDVYLTYDESETEPTLTQVHATGRANLETDPIEVMIMRARPRDTPRWNPTPFLLKIPPNHPVFDVESAKTTPGDLTPSINSESASEYAERTELIHSELRQIRHDLVLIEPQADRTDIPVSDPGPFSRELLPWISGSLILVITLAWLSIWRKSGKQEKAR